MPRVAIAGQLSIFDMEKRHPDNCSMIGSMVMSKCFCHVMECWTNCKEVNECVHDAWKGKA